MYTCYQYNDMGLELYLIHTPLKTVILILMCGLSKPNLRVRYLFGSLMYDDALGFGSLCMSMESCFIVLTLLL